MSFKNSVKYDKPTPAIGMKKEEIEELKKKISKGFIPLWNKIKECFGELEEKK